MVNLEELKSRPLNELKELALKLGIVMDGRSSAEKFALAIVEHQSKQGFEKPQQPKAQEQKPMVKHSNTKEQVMEALNPLLAKKPEFQALFPTNDTWHFKYKGAEESGNLNIPLKIILRQAEMVARGARRPLAMNQHFSDLNAVNPHSLYTNNVLNA